MITSISFSSINIHFIFAEDSNSDNGNSDSSSLPFQSNIKGEQQSHKNNHFGMLSNTDVQSNQNSGSNEMSAANTINQLGSNTANQGIAQGMHNAQTLNQIDSGQNTQNVPITGMSNLNTINQLGSNLNKNNHNDPQSQDSISNPISKISNTESFGGNINNPTKVNNDNYTNREKLIDKVSSEQELNTILDKYRNFIDVFPISDSSNPSANGNNNAIATSNSGSSHIYYLINPQNSLNPGQIIKENYSILMLKFADINNNILDNVINYHIIVRDPINNNVILQRSGSTNNGADLQVVDENTFSKGEAENPVLYQMWINIDSINGSAVNEKVKSPIIVKVG